MKITVIIYSWKNVPINNINMLCYDRTRTGVSEGIDLNKTNA